jgi:hypothetical protein
MTEQQEIERDAKPIAARIRELRRLVVIEQAVVSVYDGEPPFERAHPQAKYPGATFTDAGLEGLPVCWIKKLSGCPQAEGYYLGIIAPGYVNGKMEAKAFHPVCPLRLYPEDRYPVENEAGEMAAV